MVIRHGIPVGDAPDICAKYKASLTTARMSNCLIVKIIITNLSIGAVTSISINMISSGPSFFLQINNYKETNTSQLLTRKCISSRHVAPSKDPKAFVQPKTCEHKLIHSYTSNTWGLLGVALMEYTNKHCFKILIQTKFMMFTRITS